MSQVQAVVEAVSEHQIKPRVIQILSKREATAHLPLHALDFGTLLFLLESSESHSAKAAPSAAPDADLKRNIESANRIVRQQGRELGDQDVLIAQLRKQLSGLQGEFTKSNELLKGTLAITEKQDAIIAHQRILLEESIATFTTIMGRTQDDVIIDLCNEALRHLTPLTPAAPEPSAALPPSHHA